MADVGGMSAGEKASIIRAVLPELTMKRQHTIVLCPICQSEREYEWPAIASFLAFDCPGCNHPFLAYRGITRAKRRKSDFRRDGVVIRSFDLDGSERQIDLSSEIGYFGHIEIRAKDAFTITFQYLDLRLLKKEEKKGYKAYDAILYNATVNRKYRLGYVHDDLYRIFEKEIDSASIRHRI